MTKKTSWKTIFPAISIPLNKDFSVNEPELRKYVKWLAAFPEIGGLVTNGHTGEITSFSRAERKEITRIVADEVGRELLIVSGLNCDGTLEAIEHAKDIRDAGGDGILLMPPHMWLRFGMKPEAVYNHIKRIADAVPELGIIIHLYPAITKAFYPVETLLQLATIPSVKAIKMGTRNTPLYERDIRILRQKAPHLSLITCHDESLMTSMLPGMDGALIGFAGCIPELLCEGWLAMKKENLTKVRAHEAKIAPMAEAIYGIGQPSGEAHARLKEVLYQRGIFTSPLMREPVLPLDAEEISGVTNALRMSGISRVTL